jgi:hypothetical protein
MLGDLLIKPHQRITKYPLLLQAVLKRSPESRAQEALNAMVGALPGPGPLGVGGWWVGIDLQRLEGLVPLLWLSGGLCRVRVRG